MSEKTLESITTSANTFAAYFFSYKTITWLTKLTTDSNKIKKRIRLNLQKLYLIVSIQQ